VRVSGLTGLSLVTRSTWETGAGLRNCEIEQMTVGTTNKRRQSKGLFVGLATLDLVYVVDNIPPRNAKISVPGQHISAGGPAANAAVTFAFLGGRSALVTAVGKHPLGTVIRRDLDHFSVSVHDIAHNRNEAPPISSILVIRSSGERTVVSANSAAFPPISFEFNPRWLSGVSIVQVDGHYMPLCIASARLSRSRGIPVVLDSGSWKEGMPELLPSIDIAICSDDYRPPGCRDTSDTLEFLAGKGIRQMAITCGAAPLIYTDNRKRGKIPIAGIRATDTLGAGDIFHGAFCYYACQMGPNFRDSLAFAARVATVSCRHLGSRLWMEAFPGSSRIRAKTTG
jgi:sugar/nucleoside kinase (ribokinase family)